MFEVVRCFYSWYHHALEPRKGLELYCVEGVEKCRLKWHNNLRHSQVLNQAKRCLFKAVAKKSNLRIEVPFGGKLVPTCATYVSDLLSLHSQHSTKKETIDNSVRGRFLKALSLRLQMITSSCINSTSSLEETGSFRCKWKRRYLRKEAINSQCFGD